ncbi:MFS transporter [Caballeronia sp. SEWSISQ10-4 2]|uniref:MFS transporter n=1 Tax=Caballeronia sp. SEWSISQ10-4 2 TaxID=2937438 RepID=UPI0026599ABA|nr:MFS transporter [Caballeronia sp. SEWSISQ10-4 2]
MPRRCRISLARSACSCSAGSAARCCTRHRCLLIAAVYLCTAVCLYVTYNLETAQASIVGLSAAGFFLYGGFGPVWSVVLDLTPGNLRGVFSGFVNCGGQIGGFFAPIIGGWLVGATASFTGGFLFMIGALLVAALCFVALQVLKRNWPMWPEAAIAV